MTNIGDLLQALPATKDEIQSKLGISERTFQKTRKLAREQGIHVDYDRSNRVYTNNTRSNETQEQLRGKTIDYLVSTGLSEKEAENALQKLQRPEHMRFNTKKIDIPDRRIKYGVISDTHMGHKRYRSDILEHAAKNFKREGVEFILHAGDILEGMSGRDAHIYELDKIGATAQMDYAASELSKLTAVAPVYAITAENSHDGWFKSKGNMGLEVGPELERRVDGFNFIGYDEVDVETDAGLRIRLRHPGGGTAYAISYKMQKYINAMSGGQKPDVVHQGHYHKLNYLFYRNIHAFDAGALQEQTIFMKKKESPSMLAYTIIDVGVDKEGGVDRIRPEFVTFFE